MKARTQGTNLVWGNRKGFPEEEAFNLLSKVEGERERLKGKCNLDWEASVRTEMGKSFPQSNILKPVSYWTTLAQNQT